MQSSDPLYQLIRAVAGGSDSGSTVAPSISVSQSQAAEPLSEALNRNSSLLSQLQSLFQGQAAATAENTQALNSNTTTVAQTTAGNTAANIAKSVASTISGGFMLSPIIGGLMKLFGGGESSSTPAAIEKFSLPAKVSLEAGISSLVTGMMPLSYGQSGLPRAAAQPASVTVQVNALDSKSFLDRSGDIALAVRRAMLESSSLNDVVSEL